MKKLTSLIMLALILTGCAVIPKAVISVTSTVDYAMVEYSKIRKAGGTTVELDNKVTLLHDEYRKALTVTRIAIESYTATGDKAGTVDAIRALRDSVTPLFDLIYKVVPPQTSTNLQLKLSNATTL